MDLTIANQGGGSSSSNVLRDYRKGNWTFQETMVLIEAKKMDDERRMRRLGEGSERGKPAELRWKWVEDYCWKNGCLRSQNQCNDKWDNLMRDFKKVREYERRVAERGGENAGQKSYWRREKNERKDNNLPSNMLPQIYEALVEVVERRGGQRGGSMVVGGIGAGSSNANLNVPMAVPPHHVEKPSVSSVLGHPQQQQQLMPHALMQQRQDDIVQSPPAMLLPLPPPPAHAQAEPHIQLPFSQPLPTRVDSDTSEYSDSPAKRRKRRSGGVAAGEGTSGGVGGSTPPPTTTNTTLQEVGSAISRSASIIAEAIQSCEDREETRHRELLSVQERRLQIEESKAEINRHGVNGLVDAINKLANSILALAANRNQPPPP